MAILIDEHSNIIVQGACMRAGRMLLEDMLDYNANVCAGVCYLDATEKEVRRIPLYRHLADAMKDMPEINVSVIASGAYDVVRNALEAMEAGIRLIIIKTAFIPLKDVVTVSQEARKHNAIVLGPDSAGIISPDISMAGSMGGIHALSIFRRGKIGLISRSNGMINELSLVLKMAGLGISTAVALGTEKILLTDFIDIYKLFEADDDTDAVVITGMPGGAFEEEFAEYYATIAGKKAVTAFVPGLFIDRLKEGVSFGHLSALVYRNSGSPSMKVEALKKAGVKVVDFIGDIPQTIK